MVSPTGPFTRAISSSANAGPGEALLARGMGPLAAERADVEGGRRSAAAGRIVELRIVGQGDDRGAPIGPSAVMASSGQSLRISMPGKRLSVAKARRGSMTVTSIAAARRHGRQGLGDMDGADDDQPRRRE